MVLVLVGWDKCPRASPDTGQQQQQVVLPIDQPRVLRSDIIFQLMYDSVRTLKVCRLRWSQITCCRLHRHRRRTRPVPSVIRRVYKVCFTYCPVIFFRSCCCWNVLNLATGRSVTQSNCALSSLCEWDERGVVPKWCYRMDFVRVDSKNSHYCY